MRVSFSYLSSFIASPRLTSVTQSDPDLGFRNVDAPVRSPHHRRDAIIPIPTVIVPVPRLHLSRKAPNQRTPDAASSAADLVIAAVLDLSPGRNWTVPVRFKKVPLAARHRGPSKNVDIRTPSRPSRRKPRAATPD